MQGVLVIPGRRGIGHIRGLGFARMGEGPPVQDMDHVFTSDELNKVVIQLATVDEAISAWNYLARASALTQKIAFVSQLKLAVDTNIPLKNWVLSSEAGKNFYAAMDSSRQAFVGMTMPNLLANINILRNVIEIQVLKGKFHKGVKGRMPMYRNGSTELSYSDVDTTSSQTYEGVFDFGDLTKTTMLEDVKVMQDNLAVYGSSVKMLGEPLTVGVAIAFTVGAVLIAGIFAFILNKYLDGPQIKTPPLPPAGVDPAAWAKFLLMFNTTEESLGKQVKDIFLMLILGVGFLMIGGTGIWFLTKD